MASSSYNPVQIFGGDVSELFSWLFVRINI